MNNFKRVLEILKESESTDPIEVLKKNSVFKLKKIISTAVENFKMGPSWIFKGNNKDELIQHIDDMCNEFNLRVSSNGELVK